MVPADSGEKCSSLSVYEHSKSEFKLPENICILSELVLESTRWIIA